MTKVPVALSRDETEHGVYYYLASAVDAVIEENERLNAGWSACADQLVLMIKEREKWKAEHEINVDTLKGMQAEIDSYKEDIRILNAELSMFHKPQEQPE